ncbi:helix-turn-helix transcriptional regulator [Krasilnikovia cinnamomea]|nr:helix-turn-helix transcriptional regulator [Krasilnikovia cinnamomea]
MFETTDAQVAEQMLNDNIARCRLESVGDRHHMRVAQTSLGPVILDSVCFAMRFTAHGDPVRFIPIGRVVSGTVTYRSGTAAADHSPGDLFIACHPGQDWRATVHDLHAESAHLDPDLLAQVAATSPDHIAQPLRFTGYRPVCAQAARRWNTVFTYVREAVAGLSAVDQPLLTGRLARLLAATALVAFPNNALLDPTLEDSRDARPASLRRAVAYIDDNAHRDVSPAEIAAAARVSIRTVQLAFRRHLDTTPMAYLGRVRLEHAHREIQAADPTRTTVGEIATHWGFANHSRFTTIYRATYGITPSHALRGGRA